MNYTRWRRARRLIQVISLGFFLWLIVYTLGDLRGALAADALMRLDPLAGLAALLSGRRWLAAFIPGLILLGAALVVGRAWCGWLCPLGTVIDWVGPRSRRPANSASRWRAAKYGLLFFILLSALWGSLTWLVLDPLALFIRSVATLILPALHWFITRLEFLLYRVEWLNGPLDAFDAVLRGPILSHTQPIYGGALLLAGVLGGVLALNLIAPRAWCRYLCPLGGLYSLASRLTWFRRTVSDSCVECGRCARDCRMGTIDPQTSYRSDAGECILCLDCLADCPASAIAWQHRTEAHDSHAYDPTRRQALGALGASLGLLALANIEKAAHHPPDGRLRPPGADEEGLLATCIRCGACLRACPSHGLQPSLAESGLEGLWTPILMPRLGPCDYSCAACGQVCPTGAIPRLALEIKRETVLGKAYVDPVLCIAWSGRGPCIVCEEMCPLPEKAITLEERQAQGNELVEGMLIQVPVVQHERCIGCGLCENKCPVVGEAAIRVRVDPMG